MEIKTILICQYPLPYKKIASWTTMYNYYIQHYNHVFDYIVCPEDDGVSENVTYSYVHKNKLTQKIKNKFDNVSRFENYFDALSKVIKKNTRYIIQIVDNGGLIAPLNTFLAKKYNRSDFYIQYYYQGFDILYKDEHSTSFLNGIDEMLFLTAASYQLYKSYHNELVLRASVMPNATNSAQFFKLNATEKKALKKDLNVPSKLVFLWCSQDRPKKGLHIILDVWKRIYKKGSMELLIVGINKEIEVEGIRVIGRVPNNELAKYYQISDFYLFPSLWKEGFGIVLAEALKCGCYCIASNQGGIPEVLKNGEYGKLIENPNFIEEWVNTINSSIEEYEANNCENPFYKDTFKELYDLKNWCLKMNNQIIQAKMNMA